jgi:uncharacterized protein (TIGR03086 family)
MTEGVAATSHAVEVALLERAVGYLLRSLATIGPRDLSRPTPCAAWDVTLLLMHLDDSLSALADAADPGLLDLSAPARRLDGPLDLVGGVRDRTRDVLGGWVSDQESDSAVVAGCAVSIELVLAAGAVEVAVHGWDLATACGQRRAIPEPLAADLLPLVQRLVSDADRPGRFAEPRPVSPWMSAGDRLLALLGR